MKHLQFVDEDYKVARSFGMFIGAKLFPYILACCKPEDNPGTPVAFDTQFVLILVGHVQQNSPAQVQNVTSRYVSSVKLPTIENVVQRFWELEELPNIFIATNTCDSTGQYSAALNFKSPDLDLGDSRISAL
ncbi:hypothetical protein PR048_019879 [Dryococelus australis]|uniref:Uncharacterized protein n=1 Tax=Dryococelus australis TaxID=614101 RepID=A0ABQ9H4Q5_9NEOP|nr:hypothetical protein PR048_019879 [Dryococelus australis]